MPTAKFDGSLDSPESIDVLVDLGHPLPNRIFDGFVKVGAVGALQAAGQDTFKFILQEETNKNSLEAAILKCEFSDTELAIKAGREQANNMAKRVGKEGVQWGLVAGIYSGITYGLEESRGVRDWKNALFGGALTGAAVSLTEPNPSGERAVKSAITGGAIATAAEILKNIT